MSANHVGATYRDCPACDEYAQTVAHLFHPDSDVGPFDGACDHCRHLHDGDACPDRGRYADPNRCPKCGELATYIGVQRPDFGGRWETWCPNAHAWLATVTDAA